MHQEIQAKPIGYRFAVLHRLNSAFLSSDLKALGISLSQMPFMAELLHADTPMAQDQLSAELEIDKAATARALDQLEKKGLIKRKVNPQNRRQKQVWATQAARDIETQFFNCLKSRAEIFTDGFAPDEIELAIRLLDRMLKNARKEKYGRK